VGRSRSIVKWLASVAQLVFSSITLYEARGSQLQRYGYAAFGLSVFPYTLMTFVNLVFGSIVGEYSTIFVLRTAILDEAKRCGGTISGEIGTLPELEAAQSANAVESPVEEDRSLNGIMMDIDNDGEDRHVTPLPKVDEKTTTSGTPLAHEIIGSVGAGGEGEDGSGVPIPEDPAVFPSGEPLIAAYIRVEDDGVLVITMKGRTGRFKLIESDDDDPLTFHFHVSALTNQEEVLKREETTKADIIVFHLFSIVILNILPFAFIYLFTGYSKGNSTSAQRGWMLSWLSFNQFFAFFGFKFSLRHIDIDRPLLAAYYVLLILFFSIPAIGGFVVVAKMLLEFGACSVF